MIEWSIYTVRFNILIRADLNHIFLGSCYLYSYQLDQSQMIAQIKLTILKGLLF